MTTATASCAHATACCASIIPNAASIAAYHRDGWIVLKGVLRREHISAMREEILEVLRCRNLPDSYLAQANEYLAGGTLDGWINSPQLRAVVSTLLGGSASVYLPFTAVKGQHQGAFGFHQDNNYTPHRAAPSLNCWLALVPMSAANGALRVVTGSHNDGIVAGKPSQHAGHREVANMPTSWVDVVMEPGDVCVFDRNTVHGSGPNTTDAPRVAYAVQFHREDTEAFFDERWELLRSRPRFRTSPVATLSDQAQHTE